MSHYVLGTVHDMFLNSFKPRVDTLAKSGLGGARKAGALEVMAWFDIKSMVAWVASGFSNILRLTFTSGTGFEGGTEVAREERDCVIHEHNRRVNIICHSPRPTSLSLDNLVVITFSTGAESTSIKYPTKSIMLVSVILAFPSSIHLVAALDIAEPKDDSKHSENLFRFLGSETDDGHRLGNPQKSCVSSIPGTLRQSGCEI